MHPVAERLPIAGLVLASERSQPGRDLATWSVQSTEAEHADLRALAGEAHHPLLAVQQHVPMTWARRGRCRFIHPVIGGVAVHRTAAGVNDLP